LLKGYVKLQLTNLLTVSQ